MDGRQQSLQGREEMLFQPGENFPLAQSNPSIWIRIISFNNKRHRGQDCTNKCHPRNKQSTRLREKEIYSTPAALIDIIINPRKWIHTQYMHSQFRPLPLFKNSLPSVHTAYYCFRIAGSPCRTGNTPAEIRIESSQTRRFRIHSR